MFISEAFPIILDQSSWLTTLDLLNSFIASNLHVFTFTELRDITHHFSLSNLLGEGGFGPVHKGFVDDEFRPGLKAQPVAVKLLDLDGLEGHKEWLAEIIFFGQLRHLHLVKLIGYYWEDEHMLLIYEYMGGGSLENQLFRKCSAALPWWTRIKIAVGVANCIAFHEGDKPIIYRDFKASNILLDSGYRLIESTSGVCQALVPNESDIIGTTRCLESNFQAKIIDPHTGYVDDEYATTTILDSEGWLRTGNLCYFDSEGFLFYLDRIKELIRYNRFPLQSWNIFNPIQMFREHH